MYLMFYIVLTAIYLPIQYIAPFFPEFWTIAIGFLDSTR